MSSYPAGRYGGQNGGRVSSTWVQENPFPPAEGAIVYEVLATWGGCRCSTLVIRLEMLVG